jgi:hypothetical protein
MRRKNELHPVFLTRRFKTDREFLRRFVSDEPETSGEPDPDGEAGISRSRG